MALGFVFLSVHIKVDMLVMKKSGEVNFPICYAIAWFVCRSRLGFRMCSALMASC